MIKQIHINFELLHWLLIPVIQGEKINSYDWKSHTNEKISSFSWLCIRITLIRKVKSMKMEPGKSIHLEIRKDQVA